MNRILIVEDDSSIQAYLKALLTQEGYEGLSAYSGSEALLILDREGETLDLILLDYMLPGADGLEVLLKLRKKLQMPVIVLTATNDKEKVVEFLKQGANDYVTKPFDQGELLARIENQLRKKTAHGTVLTFKDLKLDQQQHDGFVYGKPLGLSLKEYDILNLLMSNPQRVFTKDNIYEQVWKSDYLGDENTINVHISKLRNKIQVCCPEEEYIQTVWGIGFRMKN